MPACRAAPKIVLFDADGVVQQTPPGWEAELHATLGSPPEVERLLVELFTAELPALAGERDFTEVATEVLERWGLADRTDAVLAFWTRLELDQEVTALIRELRAAGAACWLATNQHELRRAYMSTSLGYDELLDGQLYSCDLGVAKPDPAYFTRAVAQIGCDPGVGAVHRRPRGQRARRPQRRAAGRGLPPLLRRRRAARHPGGARPAVRAGTAGRPPRVGPGRAGCARGVAAQVHRRGRVRARRRAGGPSARAGGWPAAGAAA